MTQPEPTTGFRATVAELYAAGKDDLTNSSISQKIALGATALGVAFEWGPGNETLLTTVWGHAYEATHSALTSGVVTGGTSFAEQSVLGLVTINSLSNFPKLMKGIENRILARKLKGSKVIDNELKPLDDSMGNHLVEETGLDGEQKNKKFSRMGRVATRFITAFSIGASFSSIKRNLGGLKSKRENARNVFIDASLIGGGVVGLGAGVAGILNAGKALGLETEADITARVISNPLLYVSLFGLVLYLDHRKRTKNTAIEQNVDDSTAEQV